MVSPSNLIVDTLVSLPNTLGVLDLSRKQRYRGSLLGLAAGDAVGTTVEFMKPGNFTPVTDMISGGVFDLEPGQWTDDTSMALCLAESLIEKQAFDAVDQMQRYVRWRWDGLWSSTGKCFDIGNTTSDALARFERTGDAFSGGTEENTAGNGSIMRLAPVPLFFCDDPRQAIEYAAQSSRTTHALDVCVDACRYLGALIIGAIQGESRQTLLSDHYSPVKNLWKDEPLHPEIAAVAAGSFKNRQPPEIKGSGYVVQSLEAALWAFHNSSSFKQGCLMAVNLGDDADTTAAVFGQLAGAYYGAPGIPLSWRKRLTMNKEISDMADALIR